MKTIAETVGVARSNLVVQAAASTLRQRRGRRPQPEDELLAEIKGTIAGQSTPASARAGSTAIGAFMLCFGDSAANRVPRRSM